MSSGSFLVRIAGQPLPDDLVTALVGVVVDDSAQRPDSVALTLRDSSHLVLARSGATIGAPLSVAVVGAAGADPVPLITAEVTAIEAEFDGAGTFVVIRGYDRSHRLYRGRRTRAFMQMTASDIAVDVAKGAGLQVGRVDATTTVYDHVAQAGETDWAFLARLARRAGRDVGVREGEFVFVAPTDASQAPTAGPESPEHNPLVLQYGRDLIRFRAVVTAAQQVPEVEVRGWDVHTKEPIRTKVPSRTRSIELPTITAEQVATSVGAQPYVETDTPLRTQAEVDVLAKALADELAAGVAEFDGVVRGNPQVCAGTSLSVAGVGEPFDGKYTVTSARHRFDPQGGYTTSFTVSGRAERSLLGLTGGNRATHAPGGVVIATVSDVKDPQHQGRVTLTYPWLDDDYVSDWARVVCPGAGKDRGLMALPEVGDEVLVAFEQSDPRFPYVIGGVYNGVDTPDAAAPAVVDDGKGSVARRTWSSTAGHRVDLLDAASEQGVRLRDGKDTVRLLLDAARTKVVVKSDGTVEISGSRGIVLDAAAGDLQLKGTNISLNATGTCVVKGSMVQIN